MTQVTVNLLLASGKGHNLSYLLQGREVDISHKTDKFKSGEYPFYWPGNVSIFGGHIDDGETPQQAFKREIKEELKLYLSDEYVSRMDLRTYRWKEDTDRILTEANEVFQGNVNGFLGFGLDEKIPSCVLGKDRTKYVFVTYRDWIFDRSEDHYFAANIGESTPLTDYEGFGAIWPPHWVARSVCMVPIDKIALLDDMTKRVKTGELEIKVIKK
ncbi:NUDIX domain-containing protein [Candidatus Pacearchaeota archaeon]|nr:NUDIX domain-containing protein [Candidatus Pacearchaeota archaeon]